MSNTKNINRGQMKLIVCIALAAFTLAVYGQVHQFDFVNIDDNIYVTENPHIRNGITTDAVRWAFSTTYAEFWHPVTWLSLMFDYQLFGLKAGGYHMTNLILHILSTLLLFWLLNRATGEIWKSAFVAAFFALHPLHVESVAWVSERKDVLSAFFWMLTLCVYVCYTEKPDKKRYALILFCFAMALMSKSMAITLPLVMILLDYWPLRRFQDQKSNWILWQLREKAPLVGLSVVFSVITLFAQHKPDVQGLPLSSRLANAPVAFVTYLEKTFFPHDMAVFYPFSVSIPLWKILGFTLLILFISTAVIIMAKRLPCLFVGWFWYAIVLLPVIGIIQIGDFAMADRYHYLPSIGIAVMLTWGASSFIKNEAVRKRILFPAGIAFLLMLMFSAWQQCGYWKNSLDLFDHALKVANDNAVARNNRGLAYSMRGQYQLALEDFNQALMLNPGYIQAYDNRGNNYLRMGIPSRAIEDYNLVIRLKPDDARAYNNRAGAYFIQGNQEMGCRDAQMACHMGICKALEIARGRGYCH